MKRHYKPEAIISYGIILFYRKKEKIFQDTSKIVKMTEEVSILDKDTTDISSAENIFLIYQRRDSYEYMDIIKGAYETEARFKELVTRLCIDERDRLIKYNFRELWDDLWVVKSSGVYYNGYELAKTKLETYKSLIKDIPPSSKKALEPPWGFPKGRKSYNVKESGIDCAIREFEEETGIDSSMIKVLNIKPFIEIYKGNNNKLYKTKYFVAKCNSIIDIQRMKIDGCIRDSTVTEEASDVRWLRLQEACLKLEPRRQIILKSVNHIIINFESGET